MNLREEPDDEKKPRAYAMFVYVFLQYYCFWTGPFLHSLKRLTDLKITGLENGPKVEFGRVFSKQMRQSASLVNQLVLV